MAASVILSRQLESEQSMIIRLATPADRPQIDAILREAFPGPEEADLVTRLYDDGDVVISLVAVIDAAVCGTVVFSKMAAPFKALGLAPLAVLDGYRRQGVAAALVHEGIELARVEGWDGIFVLGDPEYYQRFGFLAETAAPYENPYAGPYLMAMSLLAGDLPVASGKVDYANAFAAL
jgi:putative acetyltransferase